MGAFKMPRIYSSSFHLSRDAFKRKTLPKLLRNTRNGHKKFIRMDSRDFDFLVRRLRSSLERQTFIRKPISVEERILIALRHLSSGESFEALSFLFRVAPCTIGKIVLEVCESILHVLQPEFLTTPRSEQEWIAVASGFGSKWHFKQCLAALDCKHFRVQKPANSGSRFFNRKGYFSMQLLALVDANYRFLYIDVGREGSQNDMNVWNACSFKHRLDRDRLHLPRSTKDGLPYVLIADGGFGLTKKLLTPFRRNQLTSRENRIYNYRLCRARRVVENVFGILVHRFRLFLRPMMARPETVKTCISAACVLHNILAKRNRNYIRKNVVDQENLRTGEIRWGVWRELVEEESSESENESSDDASQTDDSSVGSIEESPNEMRNRFVRYFSDTGAVAFQWRAANVRN